MPNVRHFGNKKLTYAKGMTWGEKSHRDEGYRIRHHRFRENAENKNERSEPEPGETTWQFRCAICNATFVYEGRHEGRGGTLAQKKGWRYRLYYGWVCPCERSRANLSFINPYSGEITDRPPTDKELKAARSSSGPAAPDRIKEIIAAFVAAMDEMEEIMAVVDEIEEMHHQLESVVMSKGRTLPDDEMGSGSQVRAKQAVRQVRKEFFRLLKSEGVRAALGPQTITGTLGIDMDEEDELIKVLIRLTHWKEGRWHGRRWIKPQVHPLISVIPVWEHFFKAGRRGIPTLRKGLDTLAADLRKQMSKVHKLSLSARDFTDL